MRVRGSSVRMVLLVPVVLGLGSPAYGSCPQNDAREKGVEALIAEHVKGQPAETEAALRAVLSQAKGEQRWPALARLVLLLERSGRGGDGDFASLLAEMADAHEPWSGWARARRQDKGGTGKPKDPIVELVRRWAEGDKKASPPIQQLGSLAVPEVLRQIESFGATTLRSAIAFLAQNADPSVLRAFATMLESPDPVRQVAVADALASLPPGSAKPLVETALRSAHPAIKLAALRALARTDDSARVVAELGAMARDASETQCEAIVALLVSDRLSEDAAARTLLEELAPRSHAALSAWVQSRVVGDEVAAEQMLGRLTGELRDLLLSLVIERCLPWQKLLHVAAPDANHAAGAVRCLEKHGMTVPREALVTLLRSGSPEELEQALSFLRRHPEIDATAEITRLLEDDELDEDMRRRAFGFASERIPRALLPLTRRFLGSSFQDSFVNVLLRHGDASVIGDVVDYLRPLDLQTLPVQSASCTRIVWHRSDASNLADVLRLVALPASAQAIQASWNLKVAAACGALQRWFSPDHVDPALAVLGKVDATVERCILSQVARVATSQHLSALEGLLRESLPKMQPRSRAETQPLEEPLPARARALGLIHAIGAIQAPDAVAVLEGLLAHADPEIAAGACGALLASKVADRRVIARRVLSDDRALPLLEKLLSDRGWTEDAELRQLAAKRLAQWPAEWQPADETVSLFLTELPEGERRALATAILERGRAAPEWLAEQALILLGDLGDASLVPTLALGLKHSNGSVRQLALMRLASTGSLQAVPYLLEGLKDTDGSVRTVAKESLERMSTYLEEKQKWEARFGVKPAGEKK